MSAPAALAIAKLLYPETNQPETMDEDDIQIPKGCVIHVIIMMMMVVYYHIFSCIS